MCPRNCVLADKCSSRVQMVDICVSALTNVGEVEQLCAGTRACSLGLSFNSGLSVSFPFIRQVLLCMRGMQ